MYAVVYTQGDVNSGKGRSIVPCCVKSLCCVPIETTPVRIEIRGIRHLYIVVV